MRKVEKMCGDKKTLINREKDIKSKLVKTRKIIQSKFKKAYKDRINREIDLNEKYRPLTHAINELAKGQTHQIKKAQDDEIKNLYPKPFEVDEAENEISDDDSDEDSVDFTDIDEDDVKAIVGGNKANDDEDVVFAGPSHGKHHDKRAREDDAIAVEKFSDVDEDLEIHTTSIQDGKRTRLSKQDKDNRQKTIDKKNNKKIMEMVRVAKIYQEVSQKRKQKSDAAREEINLVSNEEISDDNDSSIENVDEEEEEVIPTRNPPTKRTITNIFQQNKFRRVPQTPILQKLKARFSKSDLIKLKGKAPHRRASTYTPSMIVGTPAIDNPYLTMDEKLRRENLHKHVKGDDKKVAVKARRCKKVEKKTGGCVETEFIPYNENIAYEFYDDPNELCDRLRLLVASRSAGNSNHSQEINSIISELREAGVIE